jgi:hypothetical protein
MEIEPLNSQTLPPEIAHSCSVLGLHVDELTVAGVKKAWKNCLARACEIPSAARSTDAITLNMAKDQLILWIRENEDKAKVQKKPYPIVDDTGIALPLPTDPD